MKTFNAKDSMPEIYTAAVVGLGDIGMGYDYEDKDNVFVLTHARAFYQHPGFELIGGVDPDLNRRNQFQSKYGVPAFESIDAMYSHVKPSVVAVAVPTKLHQETIASILTHEPLGLICEKPLAENQAKAEEIVNLSKKSACPILVNYIRRFEPGVLEIKRNLETGIWGQPIAATVWYSRGLINNASHFIDLAYYLFGEISDIEIIRSGRQVLEYDMEPDFRLRAGKVELWFRAWPSEYFALNGFELFLERARLRYDNGGSDIHISAVKANPLFSDRLSLSKDETVIQNDLKRYQWHVVDALFEHLAYKKPLASNIDTALYTARIIEKIYSAGVLNAYK